MTFQPSGNPAGRPRGSRNKKTLLLEALLRKVLGMGKRSGDPGVRRILERALAPRTRKPVAERGRQRSSRRRSTMRAPAKRALMCSAAKEPEALADRC